MARMRPPVQLVGLPFPCSLDDRKELDLQYTRCRGENIESLFGFNVKKNCVWRLFCNINVVVDYQSGFRLLQSDGFTVVN